VKELHINVFNSRKDNRVRPLPTTWDNIVGFFMSAHEVVENKEDVKLFNATHYKDVDQIPDYSEDWYMDSQGFSYAKRRQVNIIEVDLLVLDYDGGTTIDEIKDRFREYEYVCYSSFRHLYDGKTHKFRVIIPFTKPIPACKKYNEHGVAIDGGEWYQIRDSLESFVGPCDPASFNANQIYSIPSAPESRVDLAFAEHNNGNWLNWEQFERQSFRSLDAGVDTPTGRSLVKTGDKHLEPDQILQTKTGSIRVKDVVGRINGVLCPFHEDTKPSEFIRKVEATGNIFLHCSTCQKNYYMRRDISFALVLTTDQQLKKDHEIKIKKDRVYTADDILEFDYEEDYYDGEDRRRVLKQLKGIQDKIQLDRGYDTGNGKRIFKSHILYMPEGSGKSRLVLDMAKAGQKIIFACKSWEQIESKYDEYLYAGIKEGFNVKVARSKDAKARRRFGTKTVREKPSKPFTTGRILDSETIDAFIKNNPDLSPAFIRLSWQFFSSDRLSFETIPHPEFDEEGNVVSDDMSAPLADGNTRIILTTFEQLRLHRLRNQYIPNEWIIWFDDPDITDVIDIDPYDIDKWKELPEHRLNEETREINGKRYYKRNHNQSLGYSLRTRKCVYTTTEVITRKAIELMMKKRKEECIVHDEMDNIVGGTITILGTHMVWKKYDGIIPLIVRRLNKEKYETRLIADGLSSEFNHSNNKGRNDIDETNILVELSIPHPVQIRTICDALDMSFVGNRNEITRSIMLDRMHQAIGRNSGYRYKGYQCVVLVDKQIHRYMIKDTRYMIDRDNSVIIDRTKMMATKDTRTGKAASPIVQKVEHLLTNLNTYISDKRKVKPDIKYVLGEIKDDSDRLTYIIRLLTSLKELSGVRFGTDQSDWQPANRVQEDYLLIGNWILETWVPREKQDYVLRQVYKDDEDLTQNYGT
jgi:hypothetical protein